jgi:hypothetical protein
MLPGAVTGGFVLLALAGRTRREGGLLATDIALLVARLVALVQFHRTGELGALALDGCLHDLGSRGCGRWLRF